MKEIEEGVWNELLQCNWISLEPISPNGLEVALSLPEDHCCDMSGAIKFCKKVLPKVRSIFVFSGFKYDVKYWIDETKEWKCGIAPKDKS